MEPLARSSFTSGGYGWSGARPWRACRPREFEACEASARSCSFDRTIPRSCGSWNCFHEGGCIQSAPPSGLPHACCVAVTPSVFRTSPSWTRLRSRRTRICSCCATSRPSSSGPSGSWTRCGAWGWMTSTFARCLYAERGRLRNLLSGHGHLELRGQHEERPVALHDDGAAFRRGPGHRGLHNRLGLIAYPERRHLRSHDEPRDGGRPHDLRAWRAHATLLPSGKVLGSGWAPRLGAALYALSAPPPGAPAFPPGPRGARTGNPGGPGGGGSGG